MTKKKLHKRSEIIKKGKKFEKSKSKNFNIDIFLKKKLCNSANGQKNMLIYPPPKKQKRKKEHMNGKKK